MSYESAMEERILKTFKSKDDLIRKLQAEIDEARKLLSNARYNIFDGDPETKEDYVDEIDEYFEKHKGG